MKWMDKLFMSHGLRVEMTEYDDVALNLGRESGPNLSKSILFVAEQLRFSDDQVRTSFPPSVEDKIDHKTFNR